MLVSHTRLVIFWCCIVLITVISATRGQEEKQFPTLDDLDFLDLTDWEYKFILGNRDHKDAPAEVARIVQQEWEPTASFPPSYKLLLTIETQNGVLLRVSLSQHRQLVSPAFKVIFRDSTGARELPPFPLPQCLYVGDVVSPSDGGKAALSRCDTDGRLRGIVITPEGHYIIHPAPKSLRSKREVTTDETDKLTEDGLHIIIKGLTSGVCGVKDIARMLAPVSKIPLNEEASSYRNETLNPSTISWHTAPSTPPIYSRTTFDPSSSSTMVPIGPVSTFTEQQPDAASSSGSPLKNDTNDDHLHRIKRMLRERTIEIAVFVDDAMYKAVVKQYPKDDPTKKVVDIVFTMINAVELIYNLPSLGVPFRLVLLRVDILTSEAISKPNKKGGEVEGYLTSFCQWQQSINPLNDRRNPNHWDHALMLTGLNLYDRVPTQDTVIGLAWVSGMCLPSYSCTINEGTSFESIYVIAHEMGHNLGMKHDGQNQCDAQKYIMSPSLGPGKVTWSTCSKEEILYFLNKTDSSCLLDSANPLPNLRHGKGTLMPGERYTATEQCQYAFGPLFRPYITKVSPYENVCRELWCQNRTYALRAHPALDGTHCEEENKVCVEGQCILDTRKGASQSDQSKNSAAEINAPLVRSTSPPPKSGTPYPRNKSAPSSAAPPIWGSSKDTLYRRYFEEVIRNVKEKFKDVLHFT